MHGRRTRILFPEQECNLVTTRMTKSSFVTKKMCKVHMGVFEIVAHRNVDNWTQLTWCIWV